MKQGAKMTKQNAEATGEARERRAARRLGHALFLSNNLPEREAKLLILASEYGGGPFRERPDFPPELGTWSGQFFNLSTMGHAVAAHQMLGDDAVPTMIQTLQEDK